MANLEMHVVFVATALIRCWVCDADTRFVIVRS
jgi:hypothetical protein